MKSGRAALVEYLERTGMTQTEFARHAGVARSLLNMFIRDRRDLSKTAGLKIARFTGIPLARLLYPARPAAGPGNGSAGHRASMGARAVCRSGREASSD